jgi:hypothetical protein
MLSFVTVGIVVALLVVLAVGCWLRYRPIRRRQRHQPLPVHVPQNVAVRVKIVMLGVVKKSASHDDFLFVSIWRKLLRLFITFAVQLTAYCSTFLRQLYLLVRARARSATIPIILLIQQINNLIALICYLLGSCVRTIAYCFTRMRRCCARVFDSLHIGGAGDIHRAGALDEARRELDSERECSSHERCENQELHKTLEVERRERQELAVALRGGARNRTVPNQNTPKFIEDAPPPGYYAYD